MIEERWKKKSRDKGGNDLYASSVPTNPISHSYLYPYYPSIS